MVDDLCCWLDFEFISVWWDSVLYVLGCFVCWYWLVVGLGSLGLVVLVVLMGFLVVEVVCVDWVEK